MLVGRYGNYEACSDGFRIWCRSSMMYRAYLCYSLSLPEVGLQWEASMELSLTSFTYVLTQPPLLIGQSSLPLEKAYIN